MNLCLLGAGGFAREVAQWLRPHIMFADTEPKIIRTPWTKDLQSLKGYDFIAAIGDPVGRRSLVERAIAAGLVCEGYALHDHSSMGDNIESGFGSIFCPGIRMTCDIVIGRHCILNLNATVGHDTRIGDFVTVNPGVNISGNVTIEDNVLIGTNACIREGVTIGKSAIVGMGAVVIKDVAPGETVVGSPARPMRVLSTHQEP